MLLSGSSCGRLGLQQLMKSGPVRVVVCRLHTSATRSSAVKTPIQKWGWEYLHRQKALHRPLSPHLTVYKPMLTWMVSGLHRVTGCAMGCALIIGSFGFMTLPLDFTTFCNFVRDLNLPSIIKQAFRFVVAFPIIFHTLNGIRFLAFDLAKGTDIKSVYKTGWLVVWTSVLLALIVVYMPQIQKMQQKK